MIPVTIETTEDGNIVLSIRQRRKVMKATYHAIARRWMKRWLRKHFLPGAGARYDMDRRSNKTRARKKRLNEAGKIEGNEDTPLIHSGLLKAAMLNAEHRIADYPTRAVVHLVGPSYLRINYKPGRPNLTDEITRVIPIEMKDMAGVGEKEQAKQIMTVAKKNKKKTIR